MTPLDWFMIVVGLYGAVLFAIGVGVFAESRIAAWRSARERRRVIRAASWERK